MTETPYLRPLTPFPIRVDENGLAGELNVRYNSQDNYMVVSFEYENKEHDPAPLIVRFEVAGIMYRHVLCIRDYYNRLVKTTLFRPEYSVWDGIRLRGIEPVVTCREDSR